jgi:SAM-dependent methyltransferase
VDCVVASLSLHHVAELDGALDQLQTLLAPGGVLVVVEWAWERFDEATAQWSFARLASPAPRGRTRLATRAPGAMGRFRETMDKSAFHTFGRFSDLRQISGQARERNPSRMSARRS